MAFHGNSLVFVDSKKRLHSKGDTLDMTTSCKFNAVFTEQVKIKKKRLLDFLDEMRFDTELTGNKNTRVRSLVNIITAPAITAGSLRKSKPNGGSTKFLHSNLNELCDTVKLLPQEKRFGKKSNIIDEKIIFPVDKLLEYKCVSTKQHSTLVDLFFWNKTDFCNVTV